MTASSVTSAATSAVRRVPGLLVAALLGACALTKFQAPQLTVVDVQLANADLWSQHLKLRLHVHNPNDRELPVSGIECSLEVEGQKFASGTSAASFVVPALGDAEFDMNVTADLSSTLLKLTSMGSGALDKDLSYRLVGKVSLSKGWLRSVPFDERGTFKLH